ncbi:hypothetical protein GCM10029978_046710 [Actinoallomurus acanthiterrae]
MTSIRPARKAIIALIVSLSCGALIAISTHISLLRTARAENARLSQATATVIEPAAPERSRPAIGHWTTTDGTRRTGAVPAPPGHTTGMSHPIWIDEAGQIADPPKSPLHRGAQTALAGACVAIAIILILTRRPQPDAIDIEWQNVGPQWHRRHL